MTHETVAVDGMSCQHCVKAVVNAIKDIKGIHRSSVSVGTVDVDIEDGFDMNTLYAAIEEAGYTVRK